VTVAVTGSTGELGGRVARRLAGLEHEQRLVGRDPARAPELPGAHVRRTAGYHDGDSMREALEGAATLLLVPAAKAPDRAKQHLIPLSSPVREAWASLAGLGAPDSEVEGWISSYTSVASGELDVVTDDVERLTGRRPTDLADWPGA
jgi:NAD(P)-dependent dehydrogenase (short-subunit alcohol dehydrogenase family)